MGGCEASGTAPLLSNCIDEPVICPGIATVHMLFKLREWRDEIFLEKIRPTVAPETTRGRPVFDVKTKFAA